MISTLTAALKAIPEIARALREINEGIRHATSSRRKEEKDIALDALLAAARTRRGLSRKTPKRTSGDNPGEPGGVG